MEETEPHTGSAEDHGGDFHADNLRTPLKMFFFCFFKHSGKKIWSLTYEESLLFHETSILSLRESLDM